MIKLLYFRVVLILFACISTIPVFSQDTGNPFSISVCSAEEITGIVIQPVPGINVRSTCSTGYTDRIQFRVVKIRRAGTFTFQITPEDPGVDYDFLSWKLSPGHANYNDFNVENVETIPLATYNRLPPADRGNRNTAGQGRTVGLRLNAPTLCRGVEGDGLERHYDTEVGDIIIIGIDNFGNGDGSGMGFGGTSELDCAVKEYECIDEVTNLATFDLDSYVDELRTPNTNYNYHFYETEQHANTNLPENRLTEHILQLPYSETGKDVFLTFELPNGNLDIVKLTLIGLKPLRLEEDIIYGCFAGENPQTGVALGTFNLAEAIPQQFLNDQLVSIKFYRSLAQAEANGTAGLIARNQWQNHNAINGTYYVRLEYDLGEGNLKCTKIIPVRLEIVRVELLQTVKELDVCYGDIINLTQFESYFAAEGTNYDYKYYLGNTLITNPSSYEVMDSDRIRVVIGKGNCTSEAFININVLETPFVEFYDTFTVCDTDFNGSYEIDLDTIRTYLGDNVGEFNYTFYLSQEDATSQTNPIDGGLVQIPIGQSLWVRANNDGTCFSIGEVPVQMGEAITFTEPTMAIEECSNPEGTTFNLSNVLPQLALSTGITVKYFPTREDAVALTNEITNPTSWTTTESTGTLYIRLSEEGKCDAIVPFQFNAIDLPTIELVEEVAFCEGETYSLDLTSYTNYTFTISGNVVEVSDKVFQFTEAGTYTITVTTASGCTNTYNFVVTIVPVPTFTPFEAIQVCDDNFDGQYEVNLSQIRTIAQANVGNPYTIKLYATEADANVDTNELTGDVYIVNALPSKVWIRANSQGECFGVSSIDIIAGQEVAYTATNQVLEVCEVEGSNSVELNLTTMAPLFNVANGVVIKYFTSLEDAQTNTNAIANPAAYSTTETAGVIYVRFEQDGFCAAITSFNYLVNPLPVIEVEPSITICEGEVYTLDLSSYTNYTFTVSGNATEIRNKVYQLSETGVYSISVTTASGCQRAYTFELNVTTKPVFTTIDAIELCDDDFDGQIVADLAQLRTIAQANVVNPFEIKLYATEADANAGTNELIGDEYIFTTLPGKIWIRANAVGECYTITSVDYTANDAVEFTATTQALEVCEVEGGTVLNLSSMAPLFNLATGVTVKYFTSLEDAQANTNAIANPATYTPADNAGTIYVRFEQDGLCASITSFNYVINPLPTITIDTTAEICEGETYVLDLSAYADYTITVTGGTVNVIRPNVFELSSTATYTVNVATAAGCARVYTIDVTVNSLPVFTDVTTYNVCDTNLDGEYELDLVALSGVVLENYSGITLGFYATEADLLAGRNEITTDIYLTRLPAQIWVKATTAAGCFVHKAITLVEGSSIDIAPAARPLEVCEGPNGVNEFDLTLIRPQFNVPSGYILSYYPTLTDLQNGTNEILNPTVWTTNTTRGTIFVKFEAAGLCPGYSTFEYVVNDNPAIELEDKYYICEDEEFVLDLSRYSNYTITVTGDNVVNLGNRRFRLSTFGMYTVNVTNASGCTTEYTFELANFPPPVVSEIIVAANTITVNVVRDPSYTPGLLQYSLDGINYQTSNVLDIPQRGRSYDIYVKVGNCVYMIQSVEVIDIPTFFSPNNDGVNDVWRIKPILLTQNVDLKIFDRFGKILYEQNDNQDIKWDGKVNGKPLPTTDYWFTIDIVGEGVVQAIKFTGSITLKNKE